MQVVQVTGRGGAVRWVAGIVLLCGLGALWYWHDPIKVAAQHAVEHYGLPALFVLTWLSDAIIQPIPADVYVFGTGFGGGHIYTTALVAGIASSLGGVTGFYIGKLIGPWRFKRVFGGKLLRGGRILFKEYGWWAVFVSGITPIPYSAVCYVGGIYQMPVMDVLVPSLIGRTGRYLLFAWLGSLA
jgi:membrane protein YqaA with SNARE-associated domain